MRVTAIELSAASAAGVAGSYALPAGLGGTAEVKQEGGRFANVDAFITAGMNALKERDEAKLAVVRAAIDKGEESGVAEGDPFARVRARLGLAQRSY